MLGKETGCSRPLVGIPGNPQSPWGGGDAFVDMSACPPSNLVQQYEPVKPTGGEQSLTAAQPGLAILGAVCLPLTTPVPEGAKSRDGPLSTSGPGPPSLLARAERDQH